MAEYIEREALMRRIKEIHCAECDSYHGVRCRACWVDDTLDYIDSEPAADVAPVRHGRWITTSGEVFPGSSQFLCYAHKHEECGFQYVGLNENEYDHCPKCGAKMDGGVDDACL